MIKLYKSLTLVIMVCTLVGACARKDSLSQETAFISPTQQSEIPLPHATTTLPQSSSPTAGLSEVDFDAFIETSYRKLLSRDPETVLELGLSKEYSVPTDRLTDISDEHIRQTQVLESDVLSTLLQYDRSTLSSAKQLTYDIYEWYLNDRVLGHEFMYDDYPINPTVFSVHLDLLQFFTDLRPVTKLQEAQDYISCLAQVDTKFEQLINGLKKREENGVVLPRYLIGWILNELNSIATSNAISIPYYTAFEGKLDALDTVNISEKQALLAEAEEAVTTSVIPAYQALVKYLEHLQTVATYDAGVWKFPDGDAYYSYALRHYTSTDLTADQIHELGLQALDRIHVEMRTIFEQLDYPLEESLPDLFVRVAMDSGSLSGDKIVQGYEDIISAADRNIGEVSDLHPSIGVIVMGDPIGGYYTAPAVDGSRPGIFYAPDTGIQPRFSMPTLAYHEAIPGHHYQIATAQQLDLPSFRRGSDFTVYVEGWALYAEQLASELGFYENDPYGELGRLQAEAFRASRLVVDTGIHAKQWTFDQAVSFMVKNTGMSEYMIQGEISRYISLPGQATAYYIGYTKIVELRQRAMDKLGKQFELKEFHNALLGNGALPLDILDQVIDNYIQSKLAGD
jgi:uncharacterized protein (DUF885 family)